MTSWTTVRVFISSTFRDMHLERDYLVRVVFPELKERCRTKHIHLIDVDLRWGVTEEEAQRGKALEICLDEIDTCRPYFIGLLGHRYGHVPPGHAHSITAQEIAHAVLHGDSPRQIADLRGILNAKPRGRAFSARQKACLAHCYRWNAQRRRYVLRDDVGAEQLSTLRSAFRQLSAFQKDRCVFFFRAEALSRSLAAGRESDFFETDDETAARVAALKQEIVDHHFSHYDYEDLQSLGQLVLETLWERISADAAENRPVADGPADEESELHERFLVDRTLRFVGRRGQLDRLHGFAESGDDGNVLVLTGEAGTGKSAVMAQFAKELTRARPEWSIFTHFVGASPASTSLRLMLRRLCVQMYDSFNLEALKQERLREIAGGEDVGREERASIEREFRIPEEAEALSATFAGFIAKAPASRHVLFVIDAVNQLEGSDKARPMRWLPQELPRNVRVVISTLAGEAADALRVRRHGGREEVLEGLTAAETRELVNAYLKEITRRFPNPRVAATFFRKVRHGNPLYILVALEELRMFGRFDELGTRVSELPESVPDLFQQVLARVEGDFTAALVRDFMVLLACARHGLRADELQALLKGHAYRHDAGAEPVKLPDMIFARLYRALGAYLFARSDVIAFFHAQLKVAVGRRYLASAADRDAAHQTLANYFRGRWREPYARALDELVHQQIKAKDWPGLDGTLCELAFVEAKCAAGLTYDLLRDYSDAFEALPDTREGAEGAAAADLRARGYAGAIAAYAEAWNAARTRHAVDPARHSMPSPHEIPLPRAIPAVPPLVESEQREPMTRAPVRSGRLTAIRSYANFARSESPGLAEFGGLPGFCVQQALHFGGSGPLAANAREMLQARREAVLLLPCGAPREGPRPNPILAMTLHGHSSAVDGVAVTADGRLAFSGSRDEQLRAWDLATGECVKRLRSPGSWVTSLAVTADGGRAFTGTNLGWIKVWSIETEEPLAEVRVHGSHVLSVHVTPDGGRVVSGASDGSLRVSDGLTEESFRTLAGHSQDVNSVSMTPDGRLAVSGGRDQTLRVWNLDARECAQVLSVPSEVRCVSLTPDGGLAVSGQRDGTVRLWDLKTGACLRSLSGHGAPVCCVAITPDGRRAISGGGSLARGADNALRLWDLDAGTCLGVLEGHTSEVISTSITPDFRKAISGSWDGTVRVWDLEKGCLPGGSGEGLGSVVCDAFSQNGHGVVCGCRDQTLRVWDAEGQSSEIIAGGESPFTLLEASADGKTAVSAHADHALRVWDLEQRRCRATLRGHHGAINAIAITPDGSRAVSGGDDGILCVWELRTGARLQQRRAHPDSVRRLCVSPEGRRAVSVGVGEAVRVWDLETGQCATSFDAPESVEVARMAPDGTRVVTAGSDGSMNVWNIQTGECVLSFATDTSFAASDFAITPDGRRAVSADWDCSLRIWDLRSGRCLAVLSGHQDDVTALSVTADGRLVFSVGRDNTVRVWDLRRFQCVAVYWATQHVISCSQIGASSSFAIATADGRSAVLRLSNWPPAAPLVTAVRRWQHGENGGSGRWHDRLVARCPLCGQQCEAPAGVLEAIAERSTESGAVPGESGTEASMEEWEAPDLVSTCASCNGAVRFNPFIVDLASHDDSRDRTSGRPLQTTVQAEAKRDRAVAATTLGAHERRISAVAVSADGLYAATGSEDGRVRVWSLEEEKEIGRGYSHRTPVMAAAMSEDGQACVSASSDGEVVAIEPVQGTLRWRIQINRQLRALALGRGGSVILYAGQDGTLHEWNVDQQTQTRVPAGDRGSIRLLAVTPDGRWAAVANDEGDLLVRNLREDRPGMTVSSVAGGGGESALALAPDGRHAVTAEDCSIRVWDVEQARDLAVFTAHRAHIPFLSVSRDGRRFISASEDGTLKVWDLEDQRLVHAVAAQRGSFTCVTSLDGQTMVAGDETGRVRVIRIHEGGAEPGDGEVRPLRLDDEAGEPATGDQGVASAPPGLERPPTGVAAPRPGRQADTDASNKVLCVKSSELRKAWLLDIARITLAVLLCWSAYRVNLLPTWLLMAAIPVCVLVIAASVVSRWARCPACQEESVVWPFKKQIRCNACRRTIVIM